MGISVDTVNLRFNVKPDYDQQQLQKLQEDLKNDQKELDKTRKALDKLSKIGLSNMTKEQREEFDKLSSSSSKLASQIQKNERRMQEYTRSTNISKLSIQQLGQRAKDLKAVLNNLNPESDEFKKYKAELDAVGDRMKELKRTAETTKEALNGFNMFKGLAIGAVGIEAMLSTKDRIVNWADQYVQSFAKMDDAMTDVMKYTGQTKREVEEMNETFKQMTTRTPREELNALAGAAGRLGIQSKKDIEGFVDAADKINVALGDDLGEGAIDQIGKLTMVFGEDKTKGLNGAMLATGSAINVLGASSSANTGFITEFTSRMAGMAVNAKISQTDIMGYASALSQAGIEGETASGVFAQMITKMFTDPAKFAKAAGLEVKAFTELLKTDANQAILQFLQGLKQNGGFDSLAPALKSLKMQGTQAVPVISSLINKMDELKDAQDTAKKAYDDGTSIIEEFNNANSSAAAKLEIAKKALNDEAVALGKQLMPIVEAGITSGRVSIQVISQLITFTTKHSKELLILAGVVSILTGMWKAYTIWQTIVDVKNKAIIAGNKVLAASMILLRSAGVALQATWALITKGMQGYIVVMRAARLASLTNPWAALATVLTVVGVAIYGVTKAWLNHNAAIRSAQLESRKLKAIQEDMNAARKKSLDSVDDERVRIERLNRIIHSNAYTIGERRKAIEKLQGIVPQYEASLTNEGVLHEKNAKAIQEHIDKLNDLAMAEALKDRMKDIQAEKFDAEEMLRRKQYNVKAVQTEIDRNPQKYKRTFVTPGGQTQTTYSDAGLKKREELEKQQAAAKAAQDAVDIAKAREKAVNDYLRKNKSIGKAYDSLFLGDNNKVVDPVGGTNPIDNNDKDDKERDKQRKEAEARLKADFEREKLLLKQQYQGKKDLKDQWQMEEIDAERYYLSKLHDVRKQYNASESEMQEVQNQIMDTWIKEANINEEARKREQQQKLKEIDQQQAADELQLARQQLTGEISTQKEYDELKLQCEIDYQKQRLQVLTEGSDEYRAAQARLEQLGLEQLKQQQSAKKGDQDWENNALRSSFGLMSSFDTMREANQAAYDQDLINFQQYQQNKTQIAEQEEQNRQAIQQAAFDAVNGLLSSAGSLFSALQQRETSQVDKKYKKQIEAAKKAGKDTTKLEEQMEAEKSEIQKKYAQKQFKLQILQIIAATAQSIANVWKEWAAQPVVAAALSDVAAVQGTAQLATAKAQADAAAGLYEGGFSEGYTEKGNPKEQAGVIPVHKNEFVANHKAVANSQVRPVLDVIDRHQKAGDIQMLNATQMLEEAYGRGRYQGGYTSQNNEDDRGEPKGNVSLSGGEQLQLLREIRDNTADSLTVREVRREIKHQERLEQNAGR